MKILIATPIYPPEAGGPSYYAKSLKAEFEKLGHTVVVRTFSVEHSLSTGIRHLFYFFKTLPAHLQSDATILLDTFSVGLPVALMKKLFGGSVVLRTGGDFLWEHYIERTGEKIVFSRFYEAHRKFSFKDKIVFACTRFVLRQASEIVFSTSYQRDVWMKPYDIDPSKVSIVENAYQKVSYVSEPTERKDFFCAVRGDMKWKNTDTLEQAFVKAKKLVPGIELDLRYDMPRHELLERLKTCYAVILVSLGDISPNFILEALSFGKPIIFTNENGLRDRIGDVVMYVDPLDETAITNAIVAMCYEDAHRMYQEKAMAFSFEHSYADIAQEILRFLPQS